MHESMSRDEVEQLRSESEAQRERYQRGLYGKFRVERADGRSAPGERHDGCDYFVLDMTHDPYALRAIRAYADGCAVTHPRLAADLKALYG